MTAISQSLLRDLPQLRPLNVVRDLPAVADLVEMCFTETLDSDGHRFIQQMRNAANDNKFLGWAVRFVESSSLPLTGYVWEESDSLVGNISVIPFRKNGEKIYLIANVAVHPDHRLRNIATNLTEVAIEHARQRKAAEIWLQVRHDNSPAINMYQRFGFQEIARRTRWLAVPANQIPLNSDDLTIRERKSGQWSIHKKWLGRLYPDELNWYQPLEWYLFHPGLIPFIMRFFTESEMQHWIITNRYGIQAVVSRSAEFNRLQRIWVAIPERYDPNALTSLLIHIRGSVAGAHKQVLDFPFGQAQDSIQNAGFSAARTLIWMKMDTTSAFNFRK
ncbi:GNAT family N-acetyltransferase [Chloroflexota bacterium]